VPSAVRKTIAPERLAISDGSPQAEKMEEKESPMTMVHCRLTESVRMPISAEGTHAVLSPTWWIAGSRWWMMQVGGGRWVVGGGSPTGFDHASPHDLEPVAAHTRPTAEKPAESRKWRG